MKKLIVLLMILMSVDGWGQFELAKFKIVFKYKATKKCTNSCSVKINTAWTWETELYNSYDHYTLLEHMTSCFPPDTKVTIQIYPTGGGYHYDYNIPITRPCTNNLTGKISDDNYDIDYILDVKPVATTVKFCDDQGVEMNEHILTDDITVMITTSAYYRCGDLIDYRDLWVFTIGEEKYFHENTSSPLSCTGNTLAAMLTNSNPNKPPLTFKNIVDKGIIYVGHIPHKETCWENFPDNKIAINPVLSAPKILSIETTPPSCHGANDGKAIVRFSRAVYQNELLQILIEGLSVGENNLRTVPYGQSVYTITGLSSGSESIVLDGKYPYQNTNIPPP